MYNKFKIPLNQPHNEFLDHLNIEGNNRILLSGRFGIGKTTFIKEFFAEEKGFELFYLLPVNYQVTKNEDVFEMIKYDILFNTIEKDLLPNEESTSDLLISQFYILNQPTDGLVDFLSVIPKIGKPLSLAIKIINFFGGYEKYKEQLKKDKIGKIREYVDNIEKHKGSIKENDFFTQLIYQTLKKENTKKNVLVIDDLDRIDPDHIFRILNIFSSHYDDSMVSIDDNKFGFDKVILVCDIENIRKVFHSKYGQDVDFSGYIDKFFSKHCFLFSNDSEILNRLDAILDIFEKNTNAGLSAKFKRWVKCIIYDFIRAQSINLRDLKKIFELKNPWTKSREYQAISRFSYNDDEFYMIKFIYALREILGNDDNKISRCFNSCKLISKTLTNWPYNELIKNLLPFYDINKIDFENLKNVIHRISIKELNLRIDFGIENSFNGSDWSFYNVNIISIVKKEEDENGSIDAYDFYFLIDRIYSNILNLCHT